MDHNRASATALAASFIRAVHTRCDRPTLVEDPYGDRLVTDAERSFILERLLLTLGAAKREEIRAIPDRARALDAAVHATPSYAGVLLRTRYTEDQLAAAVARGVAQYVLAGAGFDTFAFRRPDLRARLRIFEIDHPATQGLKRERLAWAGLEPPPNLHFVAADLETEAVAQALSRSSYASREPAFFAMLGVTPYLTREANLGTLRAIASCAAPDSEVVFDFLDTEALMPERASEEVTRMIAERAATDEPLLSGFDLQRLAGDLAGAGLEMVEELGASEAEARYCAGRMHELRMLPHSHIARARVARP